jgi:hypothetical protein
MSVRRAIFTLIAALVCVGGASAGVNQTVTATSLAGAKLGLRAADYAHILHEQAYFVTRYGDGTSRLVFPGAEVEVVLNSHGKGIQLSTAAGDYKLKGKVGPCGSAAALARRFELTPVKITGPLGARSVVYQSGLLWITLSGPDRIGRITLSSAKPSLTALINAPQCGTGEEG